MVVAVSLLGPDLECELLDLTSDDETSDGSVTQSIHLVPSW